MQFKLSSFLICFVCLFASCTHVPTELETAEGIMETHPDSALTILRLLKHEKYHSPSDHALFGLLLYNALDRNDKPLQPDSLISFSINYYQRQNDYTRLASCYFYKGHMLMHAQSFEQATMFFLKAIDCLEDEKDYGLLGKIYEDMGKVCEMQKAYEESLKKYRISLGFFKRARKDLEARYVILYMGKSYHFEKKYKTAQLYYRKAIAQIKDPLLLGAVYQEIGINFYWNKDYDSAQYYLRKSLRYPFRGNGYALRNYNLADLFFDKAQFDSSYHYATIALKYPSNFYTQRDCYRILANVKYTQKDYKSMEIYINNYQACADSIRKVELQTKATVLEKMNNATHEAKGTRQNMILIVSALILFLLLSTLLVIFLYKRNKLKRIRLADYKLQLSNKQEFVSQMLQRKIEETRILQTDSRKNALSDDRIRLDKELYNITLHINNWQEFNKEMNHAFNNIVLTLQTDYPNITHKEIIWCCLHLLDIPHPDRMILLNATSDSLYKLKQRLAQKLNLKSTKDLDSFLKDLIEIKD